MLVPDVTKIEFLAFIFASSMAVSRLIRLLGFVEALLVLWVLELNSSVPLANEVVFVLIGVMERLSNSDGDMVCGLWELKLELEPTEGGLQ